MLDQILLLIFLVIIIGAFLVPIIALFLESRDRPYKFRIVMNALGEFKPQEKAPILSDWDGLLYSSWEPIPSICNIKSNLGWYETVEQCEQIIQERMEHLARCKDGQVVPGSVREFYKIVHED